MIHFLFIMILAVTGIYDAVTKKIPDLFPGLITILAICQILANPSCISIHIVGMLIVSLPMLLLALRFGGLGGGDIKLTAACGLFLGTDAVLMGSLAAAVFALFSHCRTPASPFAFGPYLAAGFILASFL